MGGADNQLRDQKPVDLLCDAPTSASGLFIVWEASDGSRSKRCTKDSHRMLKEDNNSEKGSGWTELSSDVSLSGLMLSFPSACPLNNPLFNRNISI